MKSDEFYLESLLRFENLLIILPPFVAYLLGIFADKSYCNVVLFGDTFIITHYQAGIFWLSILFIPFTVHYVLRQQQKHSLIITFVHVSTSLWIIFSFPYIYNQLPSVKHEWKELTLPPPAFEKWEAIVSEANTLWLTFIAIQVAFLIYAATRVRFSK